MKHMLGVVLLTTVLATTAYTGHAATRKDPWPLRQEIGSGREVYERVRTTLQTTDIRSASADSALRGWGFSKDASAWTLNVPDGWLKVEEVARPRNAVLITYVPMLHSVLAATVVEKLATSADKTIFSGPDQVAFAFRLDEPLLAHSARGKSARVDEKVYVSVMDYRWVRTVALIQR